MLIWQLLSTILTEMHLTQETCDLRFYPQAQIPTEHR